MLDVTKIITQKAHESCIKQLTQVNAPFELIQQFSYQFIEEIANTLSKVTRNTFVYTGKIEYSENTLKINFTSSDKVDSISLYVTYNYQTQEQEFEFDNLNQNLEKLVTPVPPKVEVTVNKQEVTKVEGDVIINVKSDKKVKAQGELNLTVKPIPKPVEVTNPIPNVSTMLNKSLEKDKKEVLDNKVKQLTNILDRKEKAQNVTKILDTLISNDEKEKEKKANNINTLLDSLLKK